MAKTADGLPILGAPGGGRNLIVRVARTEEKELHLGSTMGECKSWLCPSCLCKLEQVITPLCCEMQATVPPHPSGTLRCSSETPQPWKDFAYPVNPHYLQILYS